MILLENRRYNNNKCNIIISRLIVIHLTVPEISAWGQVSAALEAMYDDFHRVLRVEMGRIKRFRIRHVQQVRVVLREPINETNLCYNGR